MADADAPAKAATTLSETGPVARFVLQGDEAAIERLASAVGVTTPNAINRAEGSPDGRALLRLGPDEYWLLARGEEPAALSSRLQEAFAGAAASCVDISDRQIAFQLSGPGAALALNAGTPLDLSLEAFPPGMATRTIFEKAEIALWRTGETVFHIEVARSFAPYLSALIDIAIRENAAAP